MLWWIVVIALGTALGIFIAHVAEGILELLTTKYLHVGQTLVGACLLIGMLVLFYLAIQGHWLGTYLKP